MAEWTDKEKELLHHEDFMAEVAARRAARGAQTKPRWQRFLESNGGTAIVTTLIGGVFGALISAIIQSGAKEREFEQNWLKARGDQALVAYKEYLDKEQQVVNDTHALIGACISASDDLIDITGPYFDSDKFSGRHRERVLAQREAIRNTYNSVDARWRSERIKLGLLMGYYHPNNGEISSGWQKVQQAVTGYTDCAARHYKAYSDTRKAGDTSGVCKAEKESLQREVLSLSHVLGRARRYAWENWETPDRLRKGLEEAERPAASPSPSGPAANPSPSPS